MLRSMKHRSDIAGIQDTNEYGSPRRKSDDAHWRVRYRQRVGATAFWSRTGFKQNRTPAGVALRAPAAADTIKGAGSDRSQRAGRDSNPHLRLSRESCSVVELPAQYGDSAARTARKACEPPRGGREGACCLLVSGISELQKTDNRGTIYMLSRELLSYLKRPGRKRRAFSFSASDRRPKGRDRGARFTRARRAAGRRRLKNRLYKRLMRTWLKYI